jgi:hypothetical protein
VLALESELARAGQPQGHSGGQVEASPCPEKECPPARCERLGAVGGGRGEGGVLVAEGPLEEWQPDFKVFVYDLPPEYHIDLKRDQKRCVNDQYGTEIMIHENLLQVRIAIPAAEPCISHQTLLPTIAHSSRHLSRQVQVHESHSTHHLLWLTFSWRMGARSGGSLACGAWHVTDG